MASQVKSVISLFLCLQTVISQQKTWRLGKHCPWYIHFYFSFWSFHKYGNKRIPDQFQFPRFFVLTVIYLFIYLKNNISQYLCSDCQVPLPDTIFFSLIIEESLAISPQFHHIQIDTIWQMDFKTYLRIVSSLVVSRCSYSFFYTDTCRYTSLVHHWSFIFSESICCEGVCRISSRYFVSL